MPGYKSGTNRITQHHPTSTNINKRLYRWMAVSATKALVGIVSAALHQQPHYCPDFIQRCGYANYVKWYLGIDDEHDEETRVDTSFPTAISRESTAVDCWPLSRAPGDNNIMT